MTLLASVRLVRQLNAWVSGAADDPNPDADLRRVAAVLTGTDVAHHVLDPDAVVGLDPLRSTPLDSALATLRRRESCGWRLVLPAPGRLGGLCGPAELNRAAMAAGAAVVALSGGIGLVPIQVGPAVQWRVFRAEAPGPTLTSYEAERALSETILSAGKTLARLDVAAGPGPASGLGHDLGSAAAEPPRRRAAADRAARLLLACDHALNSDGASLSSYESSIRRRELESVRNAARDALVTAVSRQVSRV